MARSRHSGYMCEVPVYDSPPPARRGETWLRKKKKIGMSKMSIGKPGTNNNRRRVTHHDAPYPLPLPQRHQLIHHSPFFHFRQYICYPPVPGTHPPPPPLREYHWRVVYVLVAALRSITYISFLFPKN